jgi:hypothetical protein
MFPISDDNPRRHLTPYVNYGLIGVCVVALGLISFAGAWVSCNNRPANSGAAQA